MVTPFDSRAFKDFIEEIASDQPLSKETAAKAPGIWKQIAGLTSQEKDATITLVQKTIKVLSSTPDTAQKVEVLRTVLFGSTLEHIPSYKRFQVMMELANRFADTLASRPEKTCKPTEVALDGQKFTAWVLPEHFLFLGCADSMRGIGGFSDSLLASNYSETLSISAVNEHTAYFMEEQKVFLVLHVEPHTVVHTQEQDIRSPRYKENTMQERTEWYDTARRMMTISGEIDSAEQAFRGILNHAPGAAVFVPYTLLDRFNRLTIQLFQRIEPDDANLEKYLKRPTPNNLSKLVENLSSKDADELEELLIEYTQVGRELKTELVRYRIIDALMHTDVPEKEEVLGILRGTKSPLEDPDDVDRLIDGCNLPDVDEEEFAELLQGADIKGIPDREELEKARSLVNRPRLKLGMLIRTLVPIYEQGLDPVSELFPGLESAMKRLKPGSKEYNELVQARAYLTDVLQPQKLFKMLFPTSKEESQGVVGKLHSLEAALQAVPATFRGWDSDENEEMDFVSWPESLVSPQELVGQTGAALSESEFGWNEINLDIEATGGGKKGGVYPTGIVISQKIFNELDKLERFKFGSETELKAVFEYAKAHLLPVFIKP